MISKHVVKVNVPSTTAYIILLYLEPPISLNFGDINEIEVRRSKIIFLYKKITLFWRNNLARFKDKNICTERDNLTVILG